VLPAHLLGAAKVSLERQSDGRSTRASGGLPTEAMQEVSIVDAPVQLELQRLLQRHSGGGAPSRAGPAIARCPTGPIGPNASLHVAEWLQVQVCQAGATGEPCPVTAAPGRKPSTSPQTRAPRNGEPGLRSLRRAVSSASDSFPKAHRRFCKIKSAGPDRSTSPLRHVQGGSSSSNSSTNDVYIMDRLPEGPQ
jgi:hypothetical protein